MVVFLVLLVLIVPLAMLVGAWLFRSWQVIYYGVAVVCAYVFGMISVVAIYRIIHDETVFMTNIHAVFQNNLFLLSGAYLGSYGIYMLQYWTLKQLRRD
ncbi:transposase [Paenibacillus sp. SYP-B3998]|uniref:Transposase n=1 Tax=Paenibacillus sp. SYP-B3998 TaxID=2678564 RepID=A0A6G3ZQD0_9BACL|nr:transposase [Paenibacillus sp. SYP-B3998]NEW04416.1 transposase [Paenibacillus sp. SYP-B3998]